MKSTNARLVISMLAAIFSLTRANAAEPGKMTPPPPVSPPPRPAPFKVDTPAKPDKGDKLKTENIKVGGHAVVAEIADDASSQERGLMFRKQMGEQEGMLFVFDRDEVLGFWMKNTLIPLAIGYFDSNMRLVDIIEMVPAAAGDMYPKSYTASRPVRYALEMNKGWFARHGLKPGAILTRPRPSTGK